MHLASAPAGLPTVTSVAPSAGPGTGGTTVTVDGTNLSGTTAVYFGGVAATDVQVAPGGGSLTAVSPASGGVADLQVVNAAGNSQPTAVDRFSYGTVVTGIAPDVGSPFGGTTVTVSGGGFVGVTAVDFGTVPATKVVTDSPTTLTVTSPPGTGTVDVTVATTSFGTSATSSVDRFSYGLHLAVTASASTLAAGGTTPTVTVQLQDPGGSPAPAPAGGQVLSLASTSAVGTFVAPGTSTPITEVTVPAGQSTASFAYTDTVAGAPTVTVGGAQAASLGAVTIPLTVTPGALAAVTVSPGSVTVPVASSHAFTAEGHDAYGNDLGSQTGTAVWSISPSSDGSSCSGASCTVAATGPHTVTATVGSVTGSATLVGDTAPVPALTPPTTSVTAGESTSFTVSGSGGAGPLTYTLEFGDGASQSGSLSGGAVTVQHTYSSAGSFPVVLSVSDGIVQPAPYTATTVQVAPAVVPVAVVGDPISATVGQTVSFNGANSTPAAGISTYAWSFGDGSTATGPDPTHVYTSPGDDTATLTVTGAGGQTSSASEAVTVIAIPDQGLTVQVTGGGGPLSGATVVVENSQDNVSDAVASGPGSYLVDGLADGSYTAYAYAPGYLPATVSATVTNGTGSATVALTQGQLATSNLTSTQLTASQATALGIDTSAPGNQYVYQFTLNLGFVPDQPPVPFHGVATGNGFVDGGFGNGGGGGGGGGCSPCSVTETDASTGISYTAVPSVAEANGQPYLIWMIIPGKAQWLKQFFDVRMLVTNLAPPAFTFTGGSATLSLPTGLSLATLAPGQPAQSLTQPVADIPGGSGQSVDWLIRGDDAGLYGLSATYTGALAPLGVPVVLTASTGADQIHIWGDTALQLTFTVDDQAYAGTPYHVQLQVTDNADVPVYNLTVGLTPQEAPTRTYIFQPDQPAPQEVAELDPGQTITEQYIVVPDFYGVLDQPASFVKDLADQEDTTAAGGPIPWTIDTQNAPAPSSYPQLTATDANDGVHLSWGAVPGAQSYEIFTTSGYLVDFPDTPLATVPGTSTSTVLPLADYGLIAVSAVLKDGSGTPYNYLDIPLVSGSSVIPSAPTEVMATPGTGSATVTWIAPPSTGLSITGYVVTPYLAGVAQTPIDVGDVTSDVVSGLTNGKAYTFTVAATDAGGTGASSAPSAPVAIGAPQAPVISSVTPASGQVTLKWKASTADAAKVTGYVVTPLVSGVAQTSQVFGKATTEVVSGLTNGDSYSFTVAALNADGNGPASAATAPVTVGAPLAPKAPTVKVKKGVLTVSWKVPASGGPAITGYIVTPYLGGAAQTPVVVTTPATSLVPAGLVAGDTYTFTVAATNAVGSGESSPPSTSIVDP